MRDTPAQGENGAGEQPERPAQDAGLGQRVYAQHLTFPSVSPVGSGIASRWRWFGAEERLPLARTILHRMGTGPGSRHGLPSLEWLSDFTSGRGKAPRSIARAVVSPERSIAERTIAAADAGADQLSSISLSTSSIAGRVLQSRYESGTPAEIATTELSRSPDPYGSIVPSARIVQRSTVGPAEAQMFRAAHKASRSSGGVRSTVVESAPHRLSGKSETKAGEPRAQNAIDSFSAPSRRGAEFPATDTFVISPNASGVRSAIFESAPHQVTGRSGASSSDEPHGRSAVDRSAAPSDGTDFTRDSKGEARTEAPASSERSTADSRGGTHETSGQQPGKVGPGSVGPSASPAAPTFLAPPIFRRTLKQRNGNKTEADVFPFPEALSGDVPPHSRSRVERREESEAGETQSGSQTSAAQRVPADRVSSASSAPPLSRSKTGEADVATNLAAHGERDLPGPQPSSAPVVSGTVETGSIPELVHDYSFRTSEAAPLNQSITTKRQKTAFETSLTGKAETSSIDRSAAHVVEDLHSIEEANPSGTANIGTMRAQTPADGLPPASLIVQPIYSTAGMQEINSFVQRTNATVATRKGHDEPFDAGNSDAPISTQGSLSLEYPAVSGSPGGANKSPMEFAHPQPSIHGDIEPEVRRGMTVGRSSGQSGIAPVNSSHLPVTFDRQRSVNPRHEPSAAHLNQRTIHRENFIGLTSTSSAAVDSAKTQLPGTPAGPTTELTATSSAGIAPRTIEHTVIPAETVKTGLIIPVLRNRVASSGVQSERGADEENAEASNGSPISLTAITGEIVDPSRNSTPSMLRAERSVARTFDAGLHRQTTLPAGLAQVKAGSRGSGASSTFEIVHRSSVSDVATGSHARSLLTHRTIPLVDRLKRAPDSGAVGASPSLRVSDSQPLVAKAVVSAPAVPAPTLPTASSQSGSTPQGLKRAEIAVLANRVYELLVRRLASERERRGQ